MSTSDKNPSPAATQPDDGSLHQLREILVGPTTRAVDERLEEFKKQVDIANQKSQQEFATRLDALERQLRAGLEQQEAKYGSAVEQAQRNLESKLDELRKQIGASAERSSKAQTETRDWIQLEIESIRAAMDQKFAALRAEFVDRQSMASLFSEMSLRVASELGAPIDASRPDDDFEIVIDQRKKT